MDMFPNLELGASSSRDKTPGLVFQKHTTTKELTTVRIKSLVVRNKRLQGRFAPQKWVNQRSLVSAPTMKPDQPPGLQHPWTHDQRNTSHSEHVKQFKYGF